MPVSIVMPVYNEQEVIEKVVRQYYAEIVAKIDGSELIVVNDGSIDSTPDILGRLARELPRLNIVNIVKNSGHAKALRAGFSRVKNPLIFHVDSDDQFKVSDFWKLYREAGENDIVLGWRMRRDDPFYRKAVSSIVRLVDAVVFGVLIKDINSPFKIIKTSVFQDVINDIPPNPFAISILIAILAKHKGYRIAEIPVSHYKRRTGKSSISNMRLLRGCWFGLVDILALKGHLLCKQSSIREFQGNIYGR